MLADIDAININAILSENEELALSEAMDQYYLYLYNCEPEERFENYKINLQEESDIPYVDAAI